MELVLKIQQNYNKNDRQGREKKKHLTLNRRKDIECRKCIRKG